MSSSLPPQDPTQHQAPAGLQSPTTPGSRSDPREPERPQEPGRARRRADRPTAPGAARASVRAAGRALRLMATEPRRRRTQRRARVALGRAVAAHLANQPAPPLWPRPWPPTARPSSASPPPTHRPAPTPPAPGGGPTPVGDSTGGSRGEAPRAQVASRASRSAGRRDLAAELERLLLIVVQFLPRLAARIRLRVADERLGAWATGMSDPQDPVVAKARAQAAEAQRAAVSARVAASANWRQAVDAARLAVRLVSEAVVDFTFWVGNGIRSGWSMLAAWLISVGVAARRRVRHGSAVAGRHVRASSAATGKSLRTGTAAPREPPRRVGRDPPEPPRRFGRGRPGCAARVAASRARRRPGRGGRRARRPDRRPGRTRPNRPRQQRHHRPTRHPAEHGR